MLAVEPSQRCELVQDSPSLTPDASPVSLARNRDQFVPRCQLTRLIPNPASTCCRELFR